MVSVEFEASMTNSKYATAHRLESAVPAAFQFHGAGTQTNRRTPTMTHAKWHSAAIQQTEHSGVSRRRLLVVRMKVEEMEEQINTGYQPREAV